MQFAWILRQIECSRLSASLPLSPSHSAHKSSLRLHLRAATIKVSNRSKFQWVQRQQQRHIFQLHALHSKFAPVDEVNSSLPLPPLRTCSGLTSNLNFLFLRKYNFSQLFSHLVFECFCRHNPPKNVAMFYGHHHRRWLRWGVCVSEGRGRGCVAMMMQQASTVSHIVRTLCSALHFAYTWLRVWLTTFHCCGQSGQRSDRVRFSPLSLFLLACACAHWRCTRYRNVVERFVDRAQWDFN